jgi:hypothetical protein
MLLNIFFFLLSIAVLLFVAPFIFMGQLVVTSIEGAKKGGMKKAWADVSDYFRIVAIDGLDQLGATILYKVRDLTVSSYTFVLCKSGKLCWFEKFIDFLFGKKHCRKSSENELSEMQDKIEILKGALKDGNIN